MASVSTESTVERGSLGPVRSSWTEGRFFHLATVFGLIPWRLASPSGSLDYVVSLDAPPCISELPAGTKPARLKVGVSPRPPRAGKPGTELGAASTFAVPNPDSRLGLSPHSQGRVMDEPSAVFVGIDVSKDRLDVHLRPSGGAFRVPRDAKGLDGLMRRLGS